MTNYMPRKDLKMPPTVAEAAAHAAGYAQGVRDAEAEYIRSDLIPALLAAEREKALREAAKLAQKKALDREAEATSFIDDTSGHEADFGLTISEAILALIDTAPPAPAPQAEWQWYAGTCEEFYSIGPCDTREQAIAEMVDDGIAETFDDPLSHSFFIVEAQQAPLRLADWIGVDDILERADEALCDADRTASEGDEGPWFEPTKAQEYDLHDMIRRACDEWQAKHGLVFTCTTFSASRNAEHVVVPAEGPCS